MVFSYSLLIALLLALLIALLIALNLQKIKYFSLSIIEYSRVTTYLTSTTRHPYANIGSKNGINVQKQSTPTPSTWILRVIS